MFRTARHKQFNSNIHPLRFAVNLSIADTMVSSLNVTFNFFFMLTGNWPFGWLYCKICTFISVLSICASVLTMVAISLDRYTVELRFCPPLVASVLSEGRS